MISLENEVKLPRIRRNSRRKNWCIVFQFQEQEWKMMLESVDENEDN